MKKVLILMIRGYQCISRCFPARCRFYPSCSDYTIEAIQKHGIVYGLWLCFRRVCQCHPWNPGGYDPVPEVRGRKTEDRGQKPD